MNSMSLGISPYIRYNWANLLRSWLVQNRVLVLLMTGYLIWTKPCREVLKSISQRLVAHYKDSPYPTDQIWAVLTPVTTYATSGRTKFNISFCIWLAAMLLFHLRLVSAPVSWQILKVGGSSIPWFATAHLIFTVVTCLVVASNTLEPGRSRIPLRQPRIETRALHDVVLVSSTAFGPHWLRSNLQTWFPRLPMFLDRRVPWLVRAAQGYNRIMNDHHILILFLVFLLLMSLLVTLWKLHNELDSWSLGGLYTAVLLFNAIFRTSVDSHARFPSFEQLWLHQALKIDGRHYELTWMHFFADSTSLSDSAVEEDRSYAQGEDEAMGHGFSTRTVLHERVIGQTYMTREEILRTGHELIKTSPGYDLFSYNCTWFRHNLFLRIKHDNPLEQRNPFHRRSSLAFQLPYYSFLSLIARYLHALAPASDETSFWHNPALKIFWLVFELMSISMEARTVVFFSSTVFCRVYRSRTIVPVAIGILLLQHSYQHLNDGLLLSPYSQVHADKIIPAMAFTYYTLLPITIACVLASPLVVACCDLDMKHASHERFQVVTDAENHNNGITHSHQSPTGAEPTVTAATTHVTVKIRSEYGERLPGEMGKHRVLGLGEFFLCKEETPLLFKLEIGFLFTMVFILLIVIAF